MTGIQQRTRRSRAGLWPGAVFALALAGVVPSTATAGPTFHAGAQAWQWTTSNSGPFSFYNGDRNTIFAPAGVQIPTGSHVNQAWCNSAYPGTQIASVTLTRRRFTAPIASNLRLIDSGNVDTPVRRVEDTPLDGIDDPLGLGTRGACVIGGIYHRTTTTPTANFLVHQSIKDVELEDLVGPSASGATAQTGWVTGDSVAFGFDQGDNPFFVGATAAAVTNSGTGVALGVIASGHVDLQVPVGGVADGQQQVCGSREGPGWSTALTCTAFLLDRHDPSAPSVALAPDTNGGWTNQDVSVVIFGSSDGSGSGVSRYQGAWYGATGWQDMPGRFAVTTDWNGTLGTRAVDNAGRVSTASPNVVVRVDKTPPTAAVKVVTAANGIVKLDIAGTADALSGLRGFTVRLNSTTGTVVAETPQELENIGAPGTAGASAGDVKLVLVAQDNAGNTATAATAVLRVGNPPSSSGPLTTVLSAGGGTGSVGGSPGIVPAQYVTTDLKAVKALGTRQVDGRVLPVVRRVYGAGVGLSGHLQTPDGSPLANVGIELRDSRARYAAGARTDASGNFTVVGKATAGGKWMVNVVGKETRAPVAWLEVRPIVRVRMQMTYRRGNHLVVRGRLLPNDGAIGKAVQLQWRDPKGRWRPAVNSRVRANGVIALRYVFRKAGGYRAKFRLTVPADNGWPFLATSTPAFNLRVR